MGVFRVSVAQDLRGGGIGRMATRRGLVERALADGETIVSRTRRHWIGLVGPLAVLGVSLAAAASGAFVLSALVAAPALPWLAKRLVEHMVITLAVTDRGRLIVARGTLHAHAHVRSATDLQGIGVEQGLAGMLLSFGDVLVYDLRTGKERIAFIGAPCAFARVAGERTRPVRGGRPAQTAA